MRHALIALAVAGALPAAASTPQRCPDLENYDVSNISVRGGTLDRIINRVLDGTAWKAEFNGPATDIRLSVIGVSGPMDLVLERVMKRAGEAEIVESVSSVIDREGCTVTVSVTTRRPTPSVLVEAPAAAAFANATTPAAVTTAAVARAERVVEPTPAERTHILPGGSKLSDALSKYVESYGWSLRWRIEEDFLIDTDIPLPQGDVVDGVLHVVRAYQSAGAMKTVRPRFAAPNKVVVIETTGDQP